MTDPPQRSGRPPGDRPKGKPPMRGAVAGSLLLATLILCAAAGFGIGAVVGAPVPLGIVGVFVGAIAGIVIVARRFSDI